MLTFIDAKQLVSRLGSAKPATKAALSMLVKMCDLRLYPTSVQGAREAVLIHFAANVACYTLTIYDSSAIVMTTRAPEGETTVENDARCTKVRLERIARVPTTRHPNNKVNTQEVRHVYPQDKLFFSANHFFCGDKRMKSVRQARYPIFKTCEEAQTTFVAEWNRVVPYDGVVVYAGFMFPPKYCQTQKAIDILDSLNGRILYARGYNDYIFSYGAAAKHQKIIGCIYGDLIEAESARHSVSIYVSAYQHSVWPNFEHGTMHVYGNGYMSSVIKSRTLVTAAARSYCVGVDAVVASKIEAYAPVSFSQLSHLAGTLRQGAE